MAALRNLSARPVSREAVEVVRERDNPRSGDPFHRNAGQPRRVPVLTAIALTATLLGTLTRLFAPGVFDSLRRDPTDLGHGQLWRLLSPVLVQGDHSLLAIIGVFVLCAVIGVAAEWLLPRSEWLLLYLLGAPRPSQKLEWAEDGREDVLLRRRGEHEPPEARGVVDGRQRDGTQSAGSTGGMWPGKTGATRVANAPAGRASISGRSWSKASSRHRLGAIW